MTPTRKTFKINLTPREAALVYTVLKAQHEANTQDLVGTFGYRILDPDCRVSIKEESAALRRVRDALARQMGGIE
jgi:hypothetical protein